jgi:hypothetical protein
MRSFCAQYKNTQNSPPARNKHRRPRRKIFLCIKDLYITGYLFYRVHERQLLFAHTTPACANKFKSSFLLYSFCFSLLYITERPRRAGIVFDKALFSNSIVDTIKWTFCRLLQAPYKVTIQKLLTFIQTLFIYQSYTN